MSFTRDAIYLLDVPEEKWGDYIGKGYRSVTYKLDQDKNGRIVLLGYDKENNEKTFICPHKCHVKYVVKYKTNETDVYGRYVTTKYFNNTKERHFWMEKNQGLTIVECYRPEQEFLQKMFYDCVFDSDFNKQWMRTACLDIETEISDVFPEPSLAEQRINMITVYDNKDDMFHTWSLDDCVVEFHDEPLCHEPKERFDLRVFQGNEKRMLFDFLQWWEDCQFTCVMAYNGRAFDIPYIIRRLENVLGKPQASRFSPVGTYRIKEVNHDNERADVSASIEVIVDGLFTCDLLLLYRDKFKIAQALDGGYSLDNVCEHEGLGNKIKYDGTLKELYMNNYQKFYEYNVRDVDLVKRLDEKCKMSMLARQIISFGLCNYDSIYSSIGYLIGSVTVFTKSKDKSLVFNSYLKEKKVFDGFEGAFVFPTTPGVYRGGIGVIDFASLYPSNIRSINASPETYVGKLLIYRNNAGTITCNQKDEKFFNVNDDTVTSDPTIVKYELKLPNGNRKAITLSQIKELLETKCIYTANNTLFLKHEIKHGMIAQWSEFFYNLRKQTKKKMLNLIHTLRSDKSKDWSEDKKAKTEIEIEILDTMQMAYKIMINSIYGMFGTGFSPIANQDIAQSVTRQGQLCNKSASKYILKLFKRRFNAQDDYNVTIGGDTDTLSKDTKIDIMWVK